MNKIFPVNPVRDRSPLVIKGLSAGLSSLQKRGCCCIFNRAVSNGVKLISGLLSADRDLLDKSKKLLEKKFGPIDLESPIVPFDFTHYYDEELGAGILRQYVSFKKLIKQEDIGKIKRQTIKLEKKFAVDEKRLVNIDPGFVSLAKLVLATTKDATYRMYLGKGIYAESTLFFKDGSFRAWPWSYPDYKSEMGIKFFNEIREIYRKAISMAKGDSFRK